jgi:hypothetical protein
MTLLAGELHQLTHFVGQIDSSLRDERLYRFLDGGGAFRKPGRFRNFPRL